MNVVGKFIRLKDEILKRNPEEAKGNSVVVLKAHAQRSLGSHIISLKRRLLLITCGIRIWKFDTKSSDGAQEVCKALGCNS